MDFQVRELQPGDNYRQVEAVQRAAWNLDDITIVPVHLLEALVGYNAGHVIGAFADGVVVGFMLVLVTRDSKVQHLHMSGVDSAWQSGHKGFHVGWEMSCFYAREVATKEGVEELEWTYDPLIGASSNLYIRKLGGRVVRYIPEAYSTTSEEGIYRGLSADRLLVRWKVAGTLPRSNRVEIPACVIVRAEEIGGSCFALAVPLDIQILKTKDLAAAQQERLRTRAVFQTALDRGYRVVGFVSQLGVGNWFIFER